MDIGRRLFFIFAGFCIAQFLINTARFVFPPKELMTHGQNEKPRVD